MSNMSQPRRVHSFVAFEKLKSFQVEDLEFENLVEFVTFLSKCKEVSYFRYYVLDLLKRNVRERKWNVLCSYLRCVSRCLNEWNHTYPFDYLKELTSIVEDTMEDNDFLLPVDSMEMS